MSSYFDYGYESHDEYTTQGTVKVRDEAQLKRFLNTHQGDDRMWWQPVSEAEWYPSQDIDFEKWEHDRMIAANIARALIRKRLTRNAYKAPTLANLWPTGA